MYFSGHKSQGLPGSPGEAGMRRWDHAPFYAIQKPEYTIPFYVHQDKSALAKKAPGRWSVTRVPEGWWEPLRTEENKGL